MPAAIRILYKYTTGVSSTEASSAIDTKSSTIEGAAFSVLMWTPAIMTVITIAKNQFPNRSVNGSRAPPMRLPGRFSISTRDRARDTICGIS